MPIVSLALDEPALFAGTTFSRLSFFLICARLRESTASAATPGGQAMRMAVREVMARGTLSEGYFLDLVSEDCRHSAGLLSLSGLLSLPRGGAGGPRPRRGVARSGALGKGGGAGGGAGG